MNKFSITKVEHKGCGPDNCLYRLISPEGANLGEYSTIDIVIKYAENSGLIPDEKPDDVKKLPETFI